MNLHNAVVKKIALGTSAAAVGTAGVAFGPDLLSTNFAIPNTIKWSSIIVAIGAVLFFLIRNGVMKYEIIEVGERGYRVRWGTVRKSRKTGERRVLYPGKKHFYIRGIYDIAVTSVRERVSRPDREKLDYVYRGRNIEFSPLIFWNVVDTEEDLYNSIFTIYQINRAEEHRTTLEGYVVNRVIGVLGRYLGEYPADEHGLPLITFDGPHVPIEVKDELILLRDSIGVNVFRLELESIKLAPEERHKEGLLGVRLGDFV